MRLLDAAPAAARGASAEITNANVDAESSVLVSRSSRHRTIAAGAPRDFCIPQQPGSRRSRRRRIRSSCLPEPAVREISTGRARCRSVAKRRLDMRQPARALGQRHKPERLVGRPARASARGELRDSTGPLGKIGIRARAGTLPLPVDLERPLLMTRTAALGRCKQPGATSQPPDRDDRDVAHPATCDCCFSR